MQKGAEHTEQKTEPEAAAMITKTEVDNFLYSLWTNCNQNSVCVKKEKRKQYLCLLLQFFFYLSEILITRVGRAQTSYMLKINLLNF